MEMDRPAPPLPTHSEAAQSPDQARLAARIVELRAQLAALAPATDEDRAASRRLADDAAAIHGRVLVLERLLAESRSREEELADRMLREASLEADLHARLTEMAGTLARATDAEALLADATHRAEEAERRAAALAEQARTHARENETLRLRVDGLETDLRAAVAEVAAAAGDRVRSAQLVRERDEARADAEAQRRAAMEGRLRNAEADARVKVLEDRVGSLHERVMGLLAKLPGATTSDAVVDLRGVDEVEGEADDSGRALRQDGGWA
jgi:chromosome segregation ATPase